MNTNFSSQFSIPVIIWKEDSQFIAYSPALDITTQGDSVEDAQSMLSDAAEGFFEVIMEQGTMSEVLTSLGWKQISKQWYPPQLVSQEYQTIQIQNDPQSPSAT